MISIVAMTSTVLVAGPLADLPRAYAAEAPVALGSAATYSVLGATGVVSTGFTTLSGDVGAGPGSSIVGFGLGAVGGDVHAGDAMAVQALSDMSAAYDLAAARTPTAALPGDLGGLTLVAGVYRTVAALALTGIVTLDGQDDPNAVFIFQVGGALNTAAASNVILTRGAQASHVFWQVFGAAGTGASSTFAGTILAAGAITLGAGANLTGRALSAAAVTLSGNMLAFTSAVNPASLVQLGSAGTYSVLGATGVTISGSTTLSGDLGAGPPSIVGLDLAVVGGDVHAGDAMAVQALSDMSAAYADAAGRTPTAALPGDLGGLTLVAGVYRTVAALALTGIVTLDGQDDPNAVFIFQVGGALNTAAASNVILTRGAQASHVFWQVFGAAGTGASSTFAGTILAAGAITLGAGANLTGRALSAAAVTLSGNTVLSPTLPTGALSITVTADGGSLGSVANQLGGVAISGPLGQVQVTDSRSPVTASGWVASVTSSAFITATGATIPASAVGYTAGTITPVGGATYTPNDPSSLTSVVPAVTATAITGDNSATWTPTITVTVPGSAIVGVYHATITHSVV